LSEQGVEADQVGLVDADVRRGRLSHRVDVRPQIERGEHQCPVRRRTVAYGRRLHVFV